MSTGDTTAAAASRCGRRFLPISLKFAGTAVALVAVVAVCVYLGLSRYERRNLIAAKEAAASMVVRLYVATAVAPLTFGDERGVQDVVALLAANDDIVHASAWSLSPDGHTLGERLGELQRGERATPPRTIPTALRVRRTQTAVVIDAPVADPTGKIVGVVQAAFSLAREYEAQAAMESRALALAVFAWVILTAALLVLARRVVVKPLARLVVAAKALERGESITIERSANDEIGTLTTAFMTMSSAIQQREGRIAERNRDMRRVLDNVDDGFVAVTPGGVMSEERSRILEEWFGPCPPGETLFDYVSAIAGRPVGQWLGVGWRFLVAGAMPVEVSVDQLPKRFERDGRFFSITYRPIMDGDLLTSMLVVFRDITAHVLRERAEIMQRQMLVVFKHVIHDGATFDEFCTDATRLVESIEHGEALDLVTLRRHVHTLKGNAAIFSLDQLAKHCHDIETHMVDEDARPTVPQLAELRVVWDAVLAMCSSFRVERAPEIRVEKAELRELVRSIRGGADVRRVESMVGSWRYERAEARMLALRDQLTSVASRLGKGAIEVSITPTTLRLPPRRWHNFWSVFGHVVRNAVDHGLEEPAARRACGKADNGLIRMSFELREDLVEFRFGDDGPGIDWERVASKALSLGLACSSREDLENAIFSDSMSTRDEATETSGRGVGMGAVRAVVRAEGGLIRIESVRDVGTTWVFVFPRTMLAAEEPLLSDPPRAVSASPERRRSRNPHATSVT